MAAIQDMTQGKPARLIIGFALPTFFGCMFQQLYSLIDSMIVGRFISSQALAAVGATGTLDWLVIGIAISLAQGYAILISQRFGAKDYKQIRKCITMSIYLCIGISLALCIGCTFFTAPLLNLMNTPADIFDSAFSYIYLIFLFSPLTVFGNLAASILRSFGDSRTPLWSMIAAALTNIVLDLVFILYFKMGVAGAAYATAVAKAVSLWICLNALKHVPFLQFKKADWKIDFPLMRKLISLGLPLALQNTITASGAMVVQSVVNSFGSVFVAGYTTARRILGLMDQAGNSLGYAMMTFASHNLGAGNPHRIRHGMRTCVAITLGCSAIVSLGVYLFRYQLSALFVSGGDQAGVILAACEYLQVICSSLWMLYLLMIFRSAVQGMGATVAPIAAGATEFLVRVLGVILFAQSMGRQIAYYAEIAAWFITGGLMIVIYFTKIRRACNQPIAQPNGNKTVS